MKGHKGRHHRSTGGVNEAAEDMGHKNQRYTYQSHVEDEAEERKRGGRAKKHSSVKVHGEHAQHHAGRKARKSGGRAGANPFAFAAHHGTPPKGRKLEMN